MKIYIAYPINDTQYIFSYVLELLTKVQYNLPINNLFSKKGSENKGKSPVSNINQSVSMFKLKVFRLTEELQLSYAFLNRQAWNSFWWFFFVFFPFLVEHVGCSLLYTSIEEVSKWYGGVLLHCA